MTWVVYSKDAETGRIHKISMHTTLRGANIRKSALQKKENSRWGDRATQIQVAEWNDYRTNINTKIWVRNLMTGVMVEELADTPSCCSVASETYWSM